MVDYVRTEYGWTFESVKRMELHTFKVMPKRWVVERTIGRMNNFRALSKDDDTDTRTGESNILKNPSLLIRALALATVRIENECGCKDPACGWVLHLLRTISYTVLCFFPS